MKKLIIAIALVCVGFGAQAQVIMEEKKLEATALPQKGTVITPKKKPGRDPRISDQMANDLGAIKLIPKIPAASAKGRMEQLLSPNGKFLLYRTLGNTSDLILLEILDRGSLNPDGTQKTPARSNELWRAKLSAKERSLQIYAFEIDEKFSLVYLTGYTGPGGTDHVYARSQVEGVPNFPKGSVLELNDNGNLAIRTPDGNIVWETNTGKK